LVGAAAAAQYNASVYYDFAIVASVSNPNIYTLQADPKGTQENDKQYGTQCGGGSVKLEINQSNQKTPSECWRK
jgi:Tfp pilus assembly protein PilE